MNKHALEVIHIGGAALMKSVMKEFSKPFVIISRTPEDIILGDETKNIRFSRKTNKVLERHVFEGSRGISRK